MTDIEERIQGSLFGGAIGDLWGSEYEGRGEIESISNPKGAFITDDTQLTLATCESILESRQISPERLAEKFAEWYSQGRLTGLGSSTFKALRDLVAGAHWALSGAKGEYTAGNGAAMRIAPIAFLIDPDSENGRMSIRDICRITHHNDEAYLGALAVAYAIRLLLLRENLDEGDILGVVGGKLPDSQVRDRIMQYAGINSPIGDVARKYGTSGFVVDSVPFALYAASKTKEIGFENVILECIKAGGDTDTVCSIAGQVSGLWTGLSNLPKHLLQTVQEEKDVSRIVPLFSTYVRINGGNRHIRG